MRKIRSWIPQNLVNFFKHLPVAFLASLYYRFPSRSLKVIGVTGTDGKTTTSNLIYQILQAAGIRAGVISTVNAVIGDEVLDWQDHTSIPNAKLHLYGKKDIRPGRKMGHVTFLLKNA